MDPAYAWLWVTIVVALLTVVCLFIKRTIKQNSRTPNLSCSVILKTMQQTKLFPLGQEQDWCLVGQCFEHRLWHTKLKTQLTDDSSLQLDIYGCYSKIKGTAQNVLSALTDITKYPEWRVSVCEVTQISVTKPQLASSESTSESKVKNPADITGVQYDVIRIKKTCFQSNILEYWISVLKSWKSSRRKDRSSCYDVNRCWNKEESGCCWLLEMNSLQKDWIFYLVQPVEKWFDIDHCVLTVIHCPGLTHSRSVSRLPAEMLAGFQNYMLFRKVQCIPVTHLLAEDGLPSDGTVTPEPSSTPPPTSKARAFFDDVVAKFAKDDKKPESMFMKRLKNLIDEKKGWYEERKRRASLKTKPTTERTDSSADNDQVTTDHRESDDDNTQTSQSKAALKSATRGSTTKPASVDDGGAEKSDESAPSTLRQRIRRRLWADRSSKSVESGSQDDEAVATPDPDQCRLDQVNQATENTLEAMYNEIAKETITEILSLKSKISNIDIQSSYEHQAKKTGGWIYCGLEKDVVILRKLHEDGASMQSFLGKGLIACSPKQVFEAIRNPKTRFTYDDMLKKVEILQEFENGMKILYWYHEVSQMFKRVSRDFCILQYEQIEGSKYVIGLKSIKWPGCPEKDDVHRATLHASGWIIEPAPKENKLHSMVTYIMQMELGRSKGNTSYLVEELAAKQPLGVAFLRQYLAPSSSTAQRDKYRNTNKDYSNKADTLSVLAAQYNNVPEHFTDNDYKPVVC